MEWSNFLPPYQPVKLPSLGYLYSNEALKSGWINIRAYAAPEESLIAQANRDNIQMVINSVLESCIKEDINVGDLTSEDGFYLLVWLRANSYSPLYQMELTCPYCKRDISSGVNLAELQVKYLDKEIKEPIEKTLPRSGLVVSLKAMRRGVEVKVQNRLPEIIKYRGIKGDPVELLKRAYCITKITDPNGEETTDLLEIEDFCLSYMPSDDSLFLDEQLERFDHGVSTKVTLNCHDCGRSIQAVLPPSHEFFRPSRYVSNNRGEHAEGDSGPFKVWEPLEPISADAKSVDQKETPKTPESGTGKEG